MKLIFFPFKILKKKENNQHKKRLKRCTLNSMNTTLKQLTEKFVVFTSYTAFSSVITYKCEMQELSLMSGIGISKRTK
jgi:hypothetical protein